ncbi:hypothetical protein M231_07949 [Tremella mesenterica]|uniref:Uncharacterized protein n=1 Tax=Tremella mesenterica TaxID=5217 RepID=A0A4Q1B858_TREME|nr:hypothetical protein M231_07949 [Tremella mesenterica]
MTSKFESDNHNPVSRVLPSFIPRHSDTLALTELVSNADNHSDSSEGSTWGDLYHSEECTDGLINSFVREVTEANLQHETYLSQPKSVMSSRELISDGSTLATQYQPTPAEVIALKWRVERIRSDHISTWENLKPQCLQINKEHKAVTLRSVMGDSVTLRRSVPLRRVMIMGP